MAESTQPKAKQSRPVGRPRTHPAPDAAIPLSEPPTLDQCFDVLCRGLRSQLLLPDQATLDKIELWYADGQAGLAWAHLVALLEGVIGEPLRVT